MVGPEPTSWVPTAMASLVPGTAASPKRNVAGVALGTVHERPFQLSAMDICKGPWPMASALEREKTATSSRESGEEGFGLGTSVQAAPSQCWMSVCTTLW